MLKIQKNISLAESTTFHIGGPAKFFVAVESGEELAEALTYARQNELKYFILGGGSNLLICDDGFDGLVVKINSNLFVAHGETLGCGAGLLLAKIVKEAAGRELTGMEWAAGIPGTLGGAIRGNAGAFGGEMADAVEAVNILDKDDLYEETDGKKSVKIKTLSKEECKFAYRNSIFKKHPDLIILSAVLKLAKGKKDEIELKNKTIIENRLQGQPRGLANSGSFFKNPVVDKPELIVQFEQDKNARSQNGKIPAAWLIERADLRGKKMGGAMVSEKHGNFIVNTGDATAQDVIMLASYVKQQVRDKFGIELQEEIQYVGF